MLLVKLSLLIFLVSVLYFFFNGSFTLLKAIAKRYYLSEPKRAITIAVIIVGQAITILEAIQKRNHEPIYETDTKNIAKRLRAITFAIAKVEEF